MVYISSTSSSQHEVSAKERKSQGHSAITEPQNGTMNRLGISSISCQNSGTRRRAILLRRCGASAAAWIAEFYLGLFMRFQKTMILSLLRVQPSSPLGP